MPSEKAESPPLPEDFDPGPVSPAVRIAYDRMRKYGGEPGTRDLFRAISRAVELLSADGLPDDEIRDLVLGNAQDVAVERAFEVTGPGLDLYSFADQIVVARTIVDRALADRRGPK